MPERRYSDDDVRRILALAAEAEAAAAAEPERPWTLGEIARIGAEAGLAPHAVTAAALALEHPDAAAAPRRVLGLPVAVSRAVPLARGLSDDDWAGLVAQLRETFAAEGRTREAGARREWRVGNLRVTHEPAGAGALLRLRTRKGDARAVLLLGAAALAMAVGFAVLAAVTAGGVPAPGTRRMAGVAILAAVTGVLTLAVGVLRLPAWARERARQFEALAAYARRIAAS